MEEVLDKEEVQRNKKEFSRSNIPKLLEILNELLPDWRWQIIPAERFDPEHESRTHFLHNNPLSKDFDKEVLIEESMLRKMLYHSLSIQTIMISTGEDQDLGSIPRLYYTLGSVECLLISYRNWARLYSSYEDWVRINSLVVSYFT